MEELLRTQLQSWESWVNIVTGIVTAGILVLAGLVALWKFVFQRPLSNHWHVSLAPCKVRQINGGNVYLLAVAIENRSTAAHDLTGWWRRVIFPSDAGKDYDVNRALYFDSETEVRQHYGHEGFLQSAYPLAPGEEFRDEIMVRRDGPLEQACFVEYTIGYSKGWLPKVGQQPEFLSQILPAPVGREDLSVQEVTRKTSNSFFRALQWLLDQNSKGEKDGDSS